MPEQKLNQAIAFYQHGQTGQAQRLCAEILENQPDHPVANRLMAALLGAIGDTNPALAHIRRSLDQTPDDLEALLTLASLQRRVGEPDQAEATLRHVLTVHPQAAAAHSNLGNLLLAIGKTAQAATEFENALACQPDFPDALFNLGVMLMQTGDYAGAAETLVRCLSVAPADADAAYNLGLIFSAQRNPDAIKAFQQALHYQPDHHEAHFSLAMALADRQKFEPMRKHFRAACGLAPANVAYRISYTVALGRFQPAGNDADLEQELLALFSSQDLNLELLFRPALNYLRAKADFFLLQANGMAIDIGQLSVEKLLEQLCEPLLLAVLCHCLAADAELEALLKASRRKILLWAADTAPDSSVANNLTGFLQALARQLHVNEYLWLADNEEMAAVDSLLGAATGADSWRALLAACYRPLPEFPEGLRQSLSDNPECSDLYRLQMADSQERELLAEQMESLAKIDDVVSRKVRSLYEDNPYPRWQTASRENGKDFFSQIRSIFPLLDPAGLAKPDRPEILVAGCGTGRHAIETASKYNNSKVLAVDLSRSSLAYAQQMSRRLGQENIDYLQADILNLAALNRKFDLIESSGVLHHMADPMAGWRVLVGLLSKHGLMRIGLYSELGRTDIVAARQILPDAESITPDDIRKSRENILALSNDHPAASIKKNMDFFALSTCRDLLFHVQEHRFTLPQIEDCLDELGLELIGFDLGSGQAANSYLQRFADNPQMDRLDHWHELEQENPALFAGMYEFWVRQRRKR
ncbi:MAG: tetratricopeptide repeat protein [Gammaproteobacteria bacterium]|nr:tetratricopeptide repeat protein [Gammaproteobacteria bacterium]